MCTGTGAGSLKTLHIKALRIVVVGCGPLMFAACGSLPDIEDVMGTTKHVPDESQVKVHQMLAMPPDYQLRPPTDGSDAASQPNPYALPNISADGSTPALTDPNAPAQDSITTQTTAPTQVANADPSAPGPQQITPGANQPANDPNTINGVSKVNPDGTPKTHRQIADELRQKRIEAKRKQNPSYGTIYNIGELFSDWW